MQLLETIRALREKFKLEYVLNVLRGEPTSVMKSYNHHELEVFGAGAEKDERFWHTVVRQCLIMKLIKKDIEQYGVLMLTDAGREFLQNPRSVMLAESHEYAEGDDDDEPIIGISGKSASGGSDEELFALLKDLLQSESRRHRLPPFVIFPETSLQDMAIQYPITQEELQSCQGVGSGKAQKFGKPFVELIAKYVDEKSIERPQDMVVKSVVNKSANKVFIIQSIDRKMDLEDIAAAKNLTFRDLLSEIETIVSSGTKLNIDYYIRQQVDEDKHDDIIDYFRNEAATDSVQEALSTLGDDDFTEEEVRLVRIKFMSENGN
jgi:ATP-dependent DNA helicase RecQ